ncbi:MAG TPA: ABC transporter permease, partial [bacterium]
MPTPAPLVIRPEVEHAEIQPGDLAAVVRPLTPWQRVANVPWVRTGTILLALVVLWELYARYQNNPLLVPSFLNTANAFWVAAVHGPLFARVGVSLRILLMGYGIGILLAAAFTSLAVASRVGTDLLSTLAAMFNPLPAIALLPLALLWFGLGQSSLVFVIVHSV